MSNIRGVPDFEGFGVLFGDADGNLDASGPPETIDLGVGRQRTRNRGSD